MIRILFPGIDFKIGNNLKEFSYFLQSEVHSNFYLVIIPHFF